MMGGSYGNFVIEGRPTPAVGHENGGRTQTITANYFQTVGIPLRRGRYFNEQDTAESLSVAIINERLAQQFFSGENPIGKRLKWSRDPQSRVPWKRIVGVIADTRSNGLGRPTPLEMFAPLPQYAVVAYSVGQRTQEFGIRMALGAGSRNVIRLVLKQALWVVGIAFVIGLPAAAVVTRFLGSYLNGVEPRDPVIFTVVPGLLGLVALFASFVPARRATRVDPVNALRYE
jgi:hypothetical protein